MIKIELQKLINKWKEEVDLIVKTKTATSTNRDMFTICLARANQLRDCIKEVELLLKNDESKQPKSAILQTPCRTKFARR